MKAHTKRVLPQRPRGTEAQSIPFLGFPPLLPMGGPEGGIRKRGVSVSPWPIPSEAPRR